MNQTRVVNVILSTRCQRVIEALDIVGDYVPTDGDGRDQLVFVANELRRIKSEIRDVEKVFGLLLGMSLSGRELEEHIMQQDDDD